MFELCWSSCSGHFPVFGRHFHISSIVVHWLSHNLGRGTSGCTCFHRDCQKLQSIQQEQVILITPWWPTQHLVQLCINRPLFLSYRCDLLSQQLRSLTGSSIICNKQALMQYFQAEGFSENASRHAAAYRRPQTAYEYQWLLFPGWAAEKGTDLLGPTAILHSILGTYHLASQTVKGYRSCQAVKCFAVLVRRLRYMLELSLTCLGLWS